MESYDALTRFILKVVPISPEDASEIAHSFTPLTFDTQAHLLEEDEVNDTYLYLHEGLMRTYLIDLEGNEVTTDFFTQNNVVFEVTSFFNRVPSAANIQAITPCSGLGISYEKLNTLFHNKPAFRDLGRAVLVKEFIASQQRNFGMIKQTAPERYQQLLATQPQIIQYSPLKYIASYLGITDSTLSRLRKNL